MIEENQGASHLADIVQVIFKIIVFVREIQFVPTPGALLGGNCWNWNSWNTEKSCMILKLVHSEYLFESHSEKIDGVYHEICGLQIGVSWLGGVRKKIESW